MKKLALIATALVTFGPAATLAAAEFPATPPAPEAPRPFALPKTETYTLRNGVKVTLVPFGSVPKAVIRTTFRAGNINDGEKAWISDLTAEMMKEGAGGRSAAEISRAAAAMGGDINIGIGLDEGSIAIDALSESAPDAIGLVADILQRPTFPEAEFDRVKGGLLRNLSIAASQPQTIADAAFLKTIYADHPYADAVLPSAETVGALTLDDVKAFHAANFGGARTHVYVVGQFDRRQVRAAIEKSFGKWAKGPAPLALIPGDAAEPSVTIVDRPGAVQSTIRYGKRVPPISDAVDLAAANTMLGGYFSSRITRNIREDKGYTYSPFSAVSSEYKAAYWRQNADITSEATGPALTEIIKEIRKLQTEPPEQADLQGVKNYMNGVFVIQLASRQGVAGRLAFVNLHELGADYLSKYVSRVSALTPEQVSKAAADHLKIDDLTLVVAGDKASVMPQLEAVPEIAGRLPKTN